MDRTCLALMCGLSSGSLALVAPAAAQAPPPGPPPAITVTGEAEVSVVPDLVTIDAGVTADGKTARQASETNNKTMGAVLLALKGQDIADKDVRTSRLSLQPLTGLPQGQSGPPQITGYRSTNHVTVTLRDIDRIANVVDALVGAGANDIGGISFAVADSSHLLDDARAKAIADAQRKAEIYAHAANVALGPPLAISEEGAQAPGPRPMFARVMAAAKAPTPISPGEETLHVTVGVSYAIRQP